MQSTFPKTYFYVSIQKEQQSVPKAENIPDKPANEDSLFKCLIFLSLPILFPLHLEHAWSRYI